MFVNDFLTQDIICIIFEIYFFYFMRFTLITVFSLLIFHCQSQFLMDMVDTTTEIGKSVLSVSQRFDHIRIGGYIQPQFQFAGQKGAKSYIGGDFPPNVNNRSEVLIFLINIFLTKEEFNTTRIRMLRMLLINCLSAHRNLLKNPAAVIMDFLMITTM